MKTPTEFELLFGKAQRELSSDQLRYWLCFCYGYFTEDITDEKDIKSTIDSFTNHLEQVKTL